MVGISPYINKMLQFNVKFLISPLRENDLF